MAKPIFMHPLKRIIELSHQGRGIKETVRLTGLSRNTVRGYLKRLRDSGVPPAQGLSHG